MPNYTVDKKQYKVLLFFCYSLVYFFIFYAYSRNCVTGFSISIFQDSVLISPPGLFKKKNYQNYLISDISSRREYFWRGRIRRCSVLGVSNHVGKTSTFPTHKAYFSCYASISAIDRHIVQHF